VELIQRNAGICGPKARGVNAEGQDVRGGAGYALFFPLLPFRFFYKIDPKDRDAGIHIQSHPNFDFFLFCVVRQSVIFTRVLQLCAAWKRRQPARWQV